MQSGAYERKEHIPYIVCSGNIKNKVILVDSHLNQCVVGKYIFNALNDVTNNGSSKNAHKIILLQLAS